MSVRPKRDGAAAVGVGAAACVACCAGPVLAFVGAIGLGTLARVLLFGIAGLAIAAIGLAVLVSRRRGTSSPAVFAGIQVPVAVEMPTIRTPR